MTREEERKKGKILLEQSRKKYQYDFCKDMGRCSSCQGTRICNVRHKRWLSVTKCIKEELSYTGKKEKSETIIKTLLGENWKEILNLTTEEAREKRVEIKF